MTSPTYEPTSRNGEPGVEPPDMPGQDPRAGDYGDQSNSTVDTAKSEAATIKDTAAGAASDVAETAKSEASNVASEVTQQARNLIGQTQTELRGQASNQQSALAGKLNGWASELGSMASKSDESGQMTGLAHEASRRVGAVSHWLDTHEPADLLTEVKRFARQRPVAFLALAAAAGIVAGRVTRGAVAANTSVDSGDSEVAPARAYDGDVYSDGSAGAMPGGASYGSRGYDDGGLGTGYREDVGASSYADSGSAAPDTTTGTSYPDVTPADDESYYPPPVGGDVRR